MVQGPGPRSDPRAARLVSSLSLSGPTLLLRTEEQPQLRLCENGELSWKAPRKCSPLLPPKPGSLVKRPIQRPPRAASDDDAVVLFCPRQGDASKTVSPGVSQPLNANDGESNGSML